MIEILGGQKIHPAWAVPGGVREALSNAGRDCIKDWLPEAKETIKLALIRFKKLVDTFHEEAISFGEFPSLFMGLVAADGTWEHYGGHLRFVD